MFLDNSFVQTLKTFVVVNCKFLEIGMFLLLPIFGKAFARIKLAFQILIALFVQSIFGNSNNSVVY